MLLAEGSFSAKKKKKTTEEIRLVGTVKFFMQLSSRISLRCPQILISVMKCSD